MSDLSRDERHVLYELDSNSRSPYSVIARACGLTQERTRYLTMRLVERGVINQFLTVVDSSQFGFALYKILLKLHSANENTVDSILEYLVGHDEVVWVVRYDGSYDVGLALKVADIVELSNFLDQLVVRYNEYIAKRIFSVNIGVEFLPREYLVRKKRLKTAQPSKHYGAKRREYTLDPTDQTILRLIAENSRISAAEISARLGDTSNLPLSLSREAVLKRIRRLERDSIITGYTLVLNLAAINHLHYKVLLFLNNLSLEEQTALVDSCRKDPRVVFMVKALGEWDYELDLNVADVAQYREVMMNLTSAHPRAIRDYTGLIFTRIHKYNLFP